MESQSYFFHETLDGSPTLSLGSLDAETMHNPMGAWAETRLIYGKAIETALERNFPKNFLSVGLGLGYTEILVACYLIKNGFTEFNLSSLESQPFLVQQFRDFFLNTKGVRADFQTNFAFILDLAARDFSLERKDITEFFRNAILNKRFIFQGELSDGLEALELQSNSVIFYDLFSAKTNPQFWTEEFLEKFLAKTAGPNCVFSTYAFRDGLTTALNKAFFTLLPTAGMGKKRQYTLAVRTNSSSN